MIGESSEIPSDYAQLRDLLAAQGWQEADDETARILLKIAEKEADGWLDPQSIAQFPCANLQLIDQLWMEYSQGRFGFTVQKNIWLECSGQVNYETECCLGQRVGWYADGSGWLCMYENQRIFDLTAPVGHFPLLFSAKTGILPRWAGGVEVTQSALSARFAACSSTDLTQKQNTIPVSPLLNVEYEQQGNTLVVKIPSQPRDRPPRQHALQTIGQSGFSRANAKQFLMTQLNWLKRQFEQTPESFEADQTFGEFIAIYSFRHERDKYLGFSLAMFFSLIVLLPLAFFSPLSVPFLLVSLWEIGQFLKKRSQVSQRQVFLYRNGMRAIRRNQESRIAGRDLIVWQHTIQFVRRNRIQGTSYSYRVRLPNGDEFTIETPAFGDAICQLVLRTQLMEKINQFERGESLTFGAIHLTSEAIFVKNKQMNWSKLPRFNIRNGQFCLPSKLFFPKVKCSEIPNLNVLVGVLQANDYFVDQ